MFLGHPCQLNGIRYVAEILRGLKFMSVLSVLKASDHYNNLLESCTPANLHKLDHFRLY